MFSIFRMLQLVSWHIALYNERPRKVKQRVKLRDIGLMMATPQNPVMGSPMECMGTVIKRNRHAIEVRWDNGSTTAYSASNLMIADFPLKFIPKFVVLDKDNPNVAFKELEYYKNMERERLEFEARIVAKKAGGKKTEEEGIEGMPSAYPTVGLTLRR